MKPLLVLAALLAQLLARLQDVLEHLVEEGKHRRMGGELLLQLLDQVPGREADGVAGRLANAGLHLPAHAGQLVHQVQQGRAHLLHRAGQAIAVLLRQGLELLLGHGLAVLGRREGESLRRAQHGDALLRGTLHQRLQRVVFALLVILLDRLDARAILLALERHLDRLADLLGEGLHLRPQPPAFAGRQAQRPRLVRIGEVVEIAPVHRRRPLPRVQLHQLAHDFVPAAPGPPQHEQVVAGPGDVQRHRHRFDGARLAERLVRLGQRLGGLESEPVRIAARAQLGRRQALGLRGGGPGQ